MPKGSPGKLPNLTARRAAFAREYLVDRNGTQAAIRAGYAKKGAGQEAERLLKNAHVSAVIAAGTAKQAQAAEITGENILRELHRIGLDPDEPGSVRVRALELAGKHTGIFTERIEVDDVTGLDDDERAARAKAMLLRVKGRR